MLYEARASGAASTVNMQSRSSANTLPGVLSSFGPLSVTGALEGLNSSKWLKHIRQILETAAFVVEVFF